VSNSRHLVPAARAPVNPRRVGRNIVVVIGIDDYRHWSRLHNAVSDAAGARTLFRDLGFEEVVPPLVDGAATRAALDELVNDTLRNDEHAALRPDDSLVVFYAGHGGVRTVNRNGKDVKIGHLIPVDAATDRFSTWIDLEAWLRTVSLLPPRHILVILDACHSGIALGPVIRWRGGELPSSSVAALHARPSRRIITSALDDERALDSGPIAGHSLFTGALIEALTGHMASAAGVITGSELAVWVRQRVRTYPGAQQTPDFGAFDHDERGEIAIPLQHRANDTRCAAGETLPTAPAPTPRRPPPWSLRLRRALQREREWLQIVVALLAVTAIAAIVRSC
jgi:uncharacterized caspase-like protein